MDRTVFTRVNVVAGPSSSHVISWWIDPSFSPTGDSQVFHVDYGYVPSAWERITPTAGVTGGSYSISLKTRYSIDNDAYFRAALIDGESEYVSMPVSVYGDVSRREWLVVSRMIQNEYFRMKNGGTAVTGWLLKRKEWGTACDACSDYDTGEAQSSTCTTCYGVGITGGYMPAVPVLIEWQAEGAVKRESVDQAGPFSAKIRKARMVAYPLIQQGDVLCNANTDVRYKVVSVTKAGAVKDMPIVYSLDLSEITGTAIENSIPIVTSVSGWSTGISEF